MLLFTHPHARPRCAGPIASLVDGHPDDRVMSRGLVRSLYLLEVPTGSPVIVQTVPLVHYLGAYPTAPLADAAAGPWSVDVGVFLMNPRNDSSTASATLTLSGSWGGGPSAPVDVAPIPAGQVVRVNASLAVPAGVVQLWWTADTAPTSRRGQPQPLYAVTASVAVGPIVISDARDVGFRVFTLVTGNDTVPAELAGVDGSGNVTMRFRLNGANLYARGADIIPMECACTRCEQ